MGIDTPQQSTYQPAYATYAQPQGYAPPPSPAIVYSSPLPMNSGPIYACKTRISVLTIMILAVISLFFCGTSLFLMFVEPFIGIFFLIFWVFWTILVVLTLPQGVEVYPGYVVVKKRMMNMTIPFSSIDFIAKGNFCCTSQESVRIYRVFGWGYRRRATILLVDDPDTLLSVLQSQLTTGNITVVHV